MKDIEFSQAGIATAPIIAALHAACFSQPWDQRAIATLLEMPGCEALLAQAGRNNPEPAGFIIYRQAADEAEIITIGVLTQYRRRAIASHLLQHTGELLRQRGADRLFLEVAVENQGASAFYRQQGFRSVGQRKDYYGANKGDALVLRKDLT